MTDAAASSTDLEALAADLDWTDIAASARARTAGAGEGRLAELVEWAAATQAEFPPRDPRRPRCVVFGPIPATLPDLAAAFGVGLQSVGVDAGASVADAVEFGVAVADAEVDSGADLLIIADPDDSAAAAVVIGLLTGAEPVSLLPRGALATDTSRWVERAEHLRDTRRRVARFRSRPDELLAALAEPALAATVAFVLRAAGRHTPMLLDGTVPLAAAVFVADIESAAGQWWQVADAAPDPVHARATLELGRRPLLDLGLTGGDGTAGILAFAVLRTAILTTAPAPTKPPPTRPASRPKPATR